MAVGEGEHAEWGKSVGKVGGCLVEGWEPWGPKCGAREGVATECDLPLKLT